MSVALGKKSTRLRAHFGHPPISNPGSTPAIDLTIVLGGCYCAGEVCNRGPEGGYTLSVTGRILL